MQHIDLETQQKINDFMKRKQDKLDDIRIKYRGPLRVSRRRKVLEAAKNYRGLA